MLPGQRSLFASGDIALARSPAWQRHALSDDSWIDVCRHYLDGADTLLDVVIAAVPWHCGRRFVYDREVDDPRLSHRFAAHETLPHHVFHDIRRDLADRYDVPMRLPALNYYRDGRDSVAFHRDRELRDVDDALIAIVTLGAERPFRVRPHATTGARSIDLAPASGDLLVMGGACQRAWEHGVPKVRAAGPRVSITWRWARSADAASSDAESAPR